MQSETRDTSNPRPTRRFRELVARGRLVTAPVCFDALSARVAAEVGLECVALGGYALGATLGVSEPLLTLTETIEAARRITATVPLPLIVDADAGFGEPLHTMRAVREFERTGVAAIHIEDQLFPKRAHYHRDYQEQIVPADDMARKIAFACQTRQDPDFTIIARTDAMRTHGYAEGVRRANLYAASGADLIMLFPNDLAEAERAPRDCEAPLVYVNSPGNRVGRPVLDGETLQRFGYRVVLDATSTLIASYRAVRQALERLKRTAISEADLRAAIAVRKAIEDTIGLDDLYRIEEQSVDLSAGNPTQGQRGA